MPAVIRSVCNIPSPRRSVFARVFAKRAIVHQVPFLLATQLESFSTFPASRHVVHAAQDRKACKSAFTSIFPIVSHNGFARLEFVSYMLGAAGIRRQGMPAAWPDVRVAAARQSASGAPGQGIAEQAGRQGSEGTGSVHGRNSAHDDDRFVRHQRHRTRDRFAAAPFAGRVLRTRPRQDALARASCCSRHASFLTAARGSISSSTRRTSCSSASTAAARCR